MPFRSPQMALKGLFRYRPAVALAVVAVALAVDVADPRPGRRLWLAGLALVMAVAALAARWLQGRVRRARWLVTGALLGDLAAATGLVALMGGISAPFVLLFPLVAFTAGLLLGTGGGVLFGLLTASAFAGLVLADAGGLAPAASSGDMLRLAFYPVFFLVVGVLAGMLGDRMAASEQALAEASSEVEKLRLDTESIIQNLSSGLMTVDRSGRIVHVNRAAELLLALPPAELRGQRVVEALGPRFQELADKIEATLREGIPLLRAEVRIEREGAEPSPIGLSTSVLKDGRGIKSGVVALFQDLTEVRRLEAASRRQDRLSVIGGMAASVAHEVRNCVNPISGSVEILQHELELHGENAKLLELIGREAAKMERLVSELLNFSRGNPMHLQDVVLETLLENTLDKIRTHPAYRPTVTLTRAWKTGPTTVQADPVQLEQVFFNLALNALEAMGPVGRLIVSLQPATADGADSVVEFADTGAGMSRETLDRIFEPFYSTKGSGTGLGLAIAQRIVERHHGRMEVSSRPGTGTRVRVLIPVVQSSAEPVAAAA